MLYKRTPNPFYHRKIAYDVQAFVAILLWELYKLPTSTIESSRYRILCPVLELENINNRRNKVKISHQPFH